MSISNFVRLARIVTRTEILVIEARIRQVTRQIPLIVSAIALIVAGLILVHVGGYAALTALWGPVWGPITLGLFDIALGFTALLVAIMLKPSPGMAIADELRKMAAEQFASELRNLPFVANTGSTFRSNTLSKLIIKSVPFVVGLILRDWKPNDGERSGKKSADAARTPDVDVEP